MSSSIRTDDMLSSQSVAARVPKPAHTGAVASGASPGDSSQSIPVVESQPQQGQTLTQDQIKSVEKAFEQLNKSMDFVERELHFHVHEDSGRMYVQVVNAAQNKVIKTIPSEELLDVIGKIHSALGLLVDTEG